MASLTQWTWVWASSGRWWRIGRPRVLQSMGSQRVGHNWVTEQQQHQRGQQRSSSSVMGEPQRTVVERYLSNGQNYKSVPGCSFCLEGEKNSFRSIVTHGLWPAVWLEDQLVSKIPQTDGLNIFVFQVKTHQRVSSTKEDFNSYSVDTS